MATMIPDRPPSERGSTKSEDLFWRELEDQLSDDFYVYHGLPYLASDAHQGEIDFLILHPELGMMNVECKGWGIERAPDGTWYRLHGGSRSRMKRSPVEQARGQIEAIVARLEQPARDALDKWFQKFPVFYCWALAFPMTTRPKINFPVDFPEELVIDAGDIADNLEERIVEAYEFHAQKFDGSVRTLPREQFDVLRREVISPSLEMPARAAPRIALEKNQILRLTEEQAEILERSLESRRLAVTGGAGTGKTVLALHGARALAKKGRDVLLTCFNAALCGYLREVVADWPEEIAGRVDVYNFHKLCAQAGRDLGDGLDFPDRDAPADETRAFWRETAPFAALEAIEREVFSLGPYDAIIVDEAQDFSEMWWEVLEGCLRDRESSQMIIFYDEAQNIFGRPSAIPDIPYRFSLEYNFRNTRRIAEVVDELDPRPIPSHPDCPEGVRPVIHHQPNPAKTRRLVGELLDTLVRREEVAPSQIAILTPHTPENSSLEGATELGGQSIVHRRSQWSEGVLHTSITSFKGLEADIVVMVDIDPSDERCSVAARYVAASRAVWGLHVFEKSHWLEP